MKSYSGVFTKSVCRIRKPSDSSNTDNHKLRLDRTSLPDRIPRQSTPPKPQMFRAGLNRAENVAINFIKVMQSNMSEYRRKDANKYQVVNEFQDRYRLSIQLVSVLAIFSIIIWCIEQELYLEHGRFSYTRERVLLLSAHLIVTILLVINIIFSYYMYLEMRRARGEMLTIDSMPRRMKIQMIIECLANLIGPYPFLANVTYKEQVFVADITIDKRIDTVLLSLMFLLRWYHWFRPILYYSYFMDNRAMRVCKIGGHNCSFMFSIKWMINVSTLWVTVYLYTFATVFFGLLLRYNEQQAHAQDDTLQNFSTRNSLWCSYITMTTVGYGDLYPTTAVGRLVGILWAITGSFLQSLGVIAVFEYLDMEPSEEISYILITTLKKQNKLIGRAAKMMTSLFKANRSKSRKDMMKYSASRMQFSRTAYNLRLERNSRMTQHDYIRKDLKGIKKDTVRIKNMAIAINIFARNKYQPLDFTHIKLRSDPSNISALNQMKIPDSHASQNNSQIFTGLNLSASPFKDEISFSSKKSSISQN